MLRFNLWLFLPLWLLVAFPPADEIDAFWAEAVRSVEEGDFEAYAALYHDDAVLVNGIADEVYPISEALTEWKQGFEDTEAGRAVTDLDFRFTKRLHGQTTAHETGIFRYSSHPVGEAAEPVYIHFEALLVREEDGWKWIMEHQKARATEEEWAAAAG